MPVNWSFPTPFVVHRTVINAWENAFIVGKVFAFEDALVLRKFLFIFFEEDSPMNLHYLVVRLPA